jgi:hypothetical protein
MDDHHLVATLHDLFLSSNGKCRGIPVEKHCTVQQIELWLNIVLILHAYTQKNS